MAVALGLGGLTVVGLAVRWWVYLRIYDLRPRFWEILRLTWFADFFNFYFLGPLGADGLRLLMLSRQYPQRKGHILGSLFVDHIGGFVASMILYVMFTRGAGIVPDGVEKTLNVVLPLFFIFCMLGVGVLMEPRVQHFIAVTRGMTVVSKPLAPMFSDVPRRRLWLLAGQVVSIASVGCGYLAYWAAARAASCEVTAPKMLGVMPLVDAVASLPITVSGLGVRENLLVELLGRQQGIGMTNALAASLLGFAALGLWGLIGGVWLLMWRRRNELPKDQAMA
jgi:uncharacterized membrane protein YbhN (UPF0104 family)